MTVCVAVRATAGLTGAVSVASVCVKVFMSYKTDMSGTAGLIVSVCYCGCECRYELKC